MAKHHLIGEKPMTSTERTARKRASDAQQAERLNKLIGEASSHLIGVAKLLESLRQPVSANAATWMAERLARASQGAEIGPGGEIEGVTLAKEPVGFGPDWKHPLQIKYEKDEAKRRKGVRAAYAAQANAAGD